MIGKSSPMLVPAVLGMAILAGCSDSGRESNAIPPKELRDNPRLAEGQRVFMQTCNQCHPGGASGIGPSLNDKRIPPFLMRLKVRHHVGAMPAFTEDVLPDPKLDDIVQYLRYLREHAGELDG
jgi:mono/diheme cytochrome c family protein